MKKKVDTKKIHYTKNGQPYRIMANGRARFMKKKTASSASKKKGGLHN